ncbi:hypothetical protein OH693_21515 [Escherichia coli]|nr:hypothetical protein [Escherichia coli]
MQSLLTAGKNKRYYTETEGATALCCRGQRRKGADLRC